MFLRRARAGQCFYQPFLGCREFSASEWELVEAPVKTIPDETINDDFGFLFHDFDYTNLWTFWPSKPMEKRPEYEISAGKKRIIRPEAQPVQKPKLHAKADKGWIVIEP